MHDDMQRAAHDAIMLVTFWPYVQRAPGIYVPAKETAMDEEFYIDLNDLEDWEILLIHGDPHPQHVVEVFDGVVTHYMESHS